MEDPKDVKQLVSPRLLEIPGVSGVGVPGDILTVYLERDSDQVRRKVRAVVNTVAPSADIAFSVTGRFRAQPV
jgi:hypothetical protein